MSSSSCCLCLSEVSGSSTAVVGCSQVFELSACGKCRGRILPGRLYTDTECVGATATGDSFLQGGSSWLQADRAGLDGAAGKAPSLVGQ